MIRFFRKPVTVSWFKFIKMADAKISALPQATSVGDTDEFVVNDSGTTKRVQAQDIISTGIAGDGLTGGGGDPLAVSVDDASIEISGDALAVKANGITYATIREDSFAHTIGYNSAMANNGATTGSYVLLKTITIPSGMVSTVGASIKAHAFFTVTDGTGTGRVAVWDTDDSEINNYDTETMDDTNFPYGMVEIELIRTGTQSLAVSVKKYLMNASNYIVAAAATGMYMYGEATFSLTGDCEDQWYIKIYVNGDTASGTELHNALAAFYPFKNSV